MNWYVQKIFNLISISVVLGAAVTQIPILLTLSTAIFWILAVTPPVAVVLLALTFNSPRTLVSKLQKLQSVVDCFISASIIAVFAYVGWTWVVAWLVVALLLNTVILTKAWNN